MLDAACALTPIYSTRLQATCLFTLHRWIHRISVRSRVWQNARCCSNSVDGVCRGATLIYDFVNATSGGIHVDDHRGNGWFS